MSNLVPRPLLPLVQGMLPEALPVAIPMDLAELPIVSASRTVRRNADGSLAPDFERVEGQYVLGGKHVHVYISSDGKDPLPYYKDMEILLAIFAMLQEDGVMSDDGFPGRLYDVPIARFAAILGRAESGDFIGHVRDALSRLAGVRIVTHVPDAEGADDILEGRRAARMPRQRRRGERGKFGLLSVRYHEDSGAIRYIQVDTTWISQGVLGWTAWVDLPRYTRLDSPVAQRLYVLAAVQAARGAAEWTYTVQELVALCRLNPGTAEKDHRKTINAALAVLVEQSVLSSGVVEKQGRGSFVVRMQAGTALTAARLLRGVGLADPAELSRQLLLLASVGITGARAREILRDAPEDAYWALCYYVYNRETQEEAQWLKDPAAFLVWAIREGRNLAADAAFYRWHQERAREHPTPLPPVAREAARPPVPRPNRVECRDPRAAELWAALCDRFRDAGMSAMDQTMIEHLGPLAIDGEALIAATHTMFARDWIASRHQAWLDSAVAESTDGRLRAVRLLLAE